MEFNVSIPDINSLRRDFYPLMRKMYLYLSNMGDVGCEITPFEFKKEIFLINENLSLNTDSVQGVEDDYGAFAMGALGAVGAGVVGALAPAAAAGGVVGGHIGALAVAEVVGGVGLGGIVAPPLLVAVGIGAAIGGLIDKVGNEDEYYKILNKIEDAKNGCIRNIAYQKLYIDNLDVAIKIAEQLCGLIQTIQQNIIEKVIPELLGVQAFLYAVNVKDSLNNSDKVENISCAPISATKGTIYDVHLVFVKNVVYYYALIKGFFCERILEKNLQYLIGPNYLRYTNNDCVEMDIDFIEDKENSARLQIVSEIDGYITRINNQTEKLEKLTVF